MTATAGHQTLLAPAPTAAAPTAPTGTTAARVPWRAAPPTAPPAAPRRAGASAMAAALAAQRSAPHRPALLRALRRAAGADPLAPAAATAYLDAVGRREVGRRLRALRHRCGTGAPWRVVHDLALPAPHGGLGAGSGTGPGLGLGPEQVDHLLVGPGGVLAVTTLHLPGARVRAGRGGLVVDGRREPHLRRAQQRAREVERLLREAAGSSWSFAPGASTTGRGGEVPVRAVVAVLGAERLALPLRAHDVAVVRAPVLVRWLRRQPHVLGADAVADLAAAVEQLARTTGGPAPDGSGTLAGFEALEERVRTADRLRRTWLAVLAVAGSAAVTTLLAAVTP
ncbi:nuclease-related domain-containing protein [Quadrisphaera sp. KR29]|uniref:nuclease-related domain-containing protein n=1 Tax=Quadrisphaera sp. KR29 TaxID=3461391 RepID=UPI004044AA1B